MFLQDQTGGANVPSANVPVAPGYVPPQVPMVMPVPDRPLGCPPGLEYLTQVDQLLVHQKVEVMEVLMGWETNNQYVVKNSLGQQVFFAAEESDFCTRMVCGPVRSFLLHVQDNVGQEVMALSRPLNCGSCCFPCCLQEYPALHFEQVTERNLQPSTMATNNGYPTDLQPQKNAINPAPPYNQGPAIPGQGQVPVMPVPQRPAGCPPGLEYLTQIDQLLVQQKVELAEVILGWETNNKYIVKNSMGQQVFFVAEENDCCNRQFCGPLRSFVLHVQDNMGQEVMTLTRPLKCGSCCFPCCLQELEIQSPPGNPIGYVIQNWHPFLPKYTIQNEKKEAVLKIVGPFCSCRCCADVNFDVLSVDESTKVGRIAKQWTGLVRETFTDADNFGISFPMDLDVKIKAALFGACFLIDFMFFEHNK
ncbi:hypothetical protein G5714_001348 [Onychostoma macrolepis]|uniref:Phospholipid scramblase n=2 Tax=Onychostoma macrolepis TaxID=369639 RepID=A0A7J6DCN3_9TELE|nr:hypothetical protein G5714_001348 [Onychostoma macrolepis]